MTKKNALSKMGYTITAKQEKTAPQNMPFRVRLNGRLIYATSSEVSMKRAAKRLGTAIGRALKSS